MVTVQREVTATMKPGSPRTRRWPVARDAAGNASSASWPVVVKPRQMPRGDVRLPQSFLERVVPRLSADGGNDAAAFETALATVGPMSVTVAASSWQLYGGGVFDRCSKKGLFGGDNTLDHGVQAVGYTATKHQREVGAGYFDAVTQCVTAGTSSITALTGSTEEAQFEKTG